MKHLSEEELVEACYGESGAAGVAHLAACPECAAQLLELKRDLEGVMRTEVPERDAEYGERVWETLRPRLIPYEKKAAGWQKFFSKGGAQGRAALLALGCAALVAAAFVGGRVWERHTTKTTKVASASPSPQAKERVVLVVLTDHLDRTERLLVSLEHADSSDKAENAQLQSEARELLASNRLYRTTASDAGDPVLAGALDRVEGVLAEVANDPNLTAEDLQRLRDEMNSAGILFEIRVLLAQTPDQASGPKPAKGATI